MIKYEPIIFPIATEIIDDYRYDTTIGESAKKNLILDLIEHTLGLENPRKDPCAIIYDDLSAVVFSARKEKREAPQDIKETTSDGEGLSALLIEQKPHYLFTKKSTIEKLMIYLKQVPSIDARLHKSLKSE